MFCSFQSMIFVLLFLKNFFLLRWSSYNIKLTILTCTIQWHIHYVFITHSQYCTTATFIKFQTFSSPQRTTLYPSSSPSPFLPPCLSWPPAIFFLCARIYLFWVFHINGIMLHVTFVFVSFYLTQCLGGSLICSTYLYFITFYSWAISDCVMYTVFHWSICHLMDI